MRTLTAVACAALLLGSPAAAEPEPAAGAPPVTAAATGASAVVQSPPETPAVGQAPPAVATPEGPSAAQAAAPPPPPPPPTLIVNIDLSKQRITVTDNGRSVHSWPISSARSGYRTPTGTFKPQWMSRMWYSRQYDLSPMPYAIFFHRGVAVHGTSETGRLGQPASHGCVRLAPGSAAKLFRLVERHGKDMTRIVVRGSPPPTPVARAPRRDGRYAGPDPYYGYGGNRRGYWNGPGYNEPYPPSRRNRPVAGYGGWFFD